MNPAPPSARNNNPYMTAFFSCSTGSVKVKMLRTSANTMALSGSTEPAMAEKKQPTEKYKNY